MKPDDDVMTLHASYRLSNPQHHNHAASFCRIMGKSKCRHCKVWIIYHKKTSQDIRRIVDFLVSSSTLSTTFRCLEVLCSSVYRRMWVLCLSENVNPRTKTKHLVNMLDEAGQIVSLSTVRRFTDQHELRGYSERKKPLLQNKDSLHTRTKTLVSYTSSARRWKFQ